MSVFPEQETFHNERMPYPFRPNVLKMAPYSPGKPIDEVKRELGLTDVVKLASNENPLGPSPKAIEAIRNAAADCHLYPDASSYELRMAISRKFGMPYDQVMVGNGSDELIHLLGMIFLNPGDQMIVGYPSFVRYDAAAELTESECIRVPVDSEYRIDLPAMRRAVTERTKLVWIANPNNPTGTINSKEALTAFLDSLPDHIVTVLDEAYFEYAAENPDYPNSLDYIRAGKQVIGLRTFSKAYGLAGLRVGYGFAAPEVVDSIHRAREPFNVNSLAQVGAIAALSDDAFLEKTLKMNREGRERLHEVFQEFGAKPVQSYANFVLADFGQPTEPLFQALLAQGVIVRQGLPTCLRVSVGTADECTRFINALRAIMKEKVTI